MPRAASTMGAWGRCSGSAIASKANGLLTRRARCIIAPVTNDESLRERFGVLFERRYPELCHFVLQFVRSRAVAEELVQDLFLRVWEQRAKWEQELPSRR